MKKQANVFNPCERIWKQTNTATGVIYLTTYKQLEGHF